MTPLADTGRVIGGRYRLEAPIGRGAMGIVWRARDELLDRDVAVKEVQLADTLSADERANAYQRTLREAKTAARLSHPGVVSVYDVADDDGRPWIVMELVNARSLDQVLAVEGPLSPRQTAEIGRQLLAALSVAHSAGVLHRDVKPSNVLLGQDGRAVLTDFGIATFQGDPKLTQTGMVMGSPGFTAPERIRGGPATPASDLWSLGATLYAAAQGHGPFESRGGAITTMSAIINEDAPAAPAAGALSRVIEALLRREPTARPDAVTASRMISDVTPLLSDRPGAGGYQPTAMSAATPGGSYGGSYAGSYADGVPSVETSMDPVSEELVASPGDQVAAATVLEASAALAPAPAPSAPSAADAPSAPPTMPQPSLDSPVVGFTGANTPEPDFSSWYSSARPSSPAPEYAIPAPGYAAQQPPDVAAWPQAPPSSSAPAKPPAGPARVRYRWILALVALAIVGAGVGAAAVMLLRHPSSGNAANAASTTQGPPGGTSTGPLDIIHAINQPSSGPFPSGFTSYTLRASAVNAVAGFSLSYPGSWQVQHSSYQTFFRDPDLNAYVLVDLTPHTFPGDMMREARYIRNHSVGAHPDYTPLGGIRALAIRGSAGAFWKFSYDDNGVTQEVIDLLWVANTAAGRQSYAMYFTAPASSWLTMRPTFTAIAQSFQPVTS